MAGCELKLDQLHPARFPRQYLRGWRQHGVFGLRQPRVLELGIDLAEAGGFFSALNETAIPAESVLGHARRHLLHRIASDHLLRDDQPPGLATNPGQAQAKDRRRAHSDNRSHYDRQRGS